MTAVSIAHAAQSNLESVQQAPLPLYSGGEGLGRGGGFGRKKPPHPQPLSPPSTRARGTYWTPPMRPYWPCLVRKCRRPPVRPDCAQAATPAACVTGGIRPPEPRRDRPTHAARPGQSCPGPQTSPPSLGLAFALLAACLLALLFGTHGVRLIELGGRRRQSPLFLQLVDALLGCQSCCCVVRSCHY